MTDQSPDRQAHLDHAALSALAETHGASFFVLDAVRFRANFRALLGAFTAHYPDVRIGYSYKTNYTPHLCRIAHDEGGFAEVVSEMEYAAARRIGVPCERRHRKKIEILADRKVALKQKRPIINQRGGFIGTLASVALPVLTGIIAKAVLKKKKKSKKKQK